MSENLKTELRELRKLIIFAIRLFGSMFLIQQLIWAAWALIG